jgi:hypothetical protein
MGSDNVNLVQDHKFLWFNSCARICVPSIALSGSMVILSSYTISSSGTPAVISFILHITAVAGTLMAVEINAATCQLVIADVQLSMDPIYIPRVAEPVHQSVSWGIAVLT